MAKFTFGQIAKEVRLTYNGDKTDMPIVGLEHIVPKELTVTNYDINTNNTFTKSFKKGQILFGRRRAYQHKAAIATFNGICSGDITVIEPIEGMVYPALLPFIVQNDAFFSHAVQGSAGSLSPRVKWEHLSSYEIELPSIEEQRVLAEKLWAAYRLKESYKRLLAATDEMIKSQFIEMFGNPLFNTKKWECYSNINTITTIVLGSTPNTKEPKYWDGDIKWITPAEMDDETFMINDTLRHITDVGVKSATLTKLPVGTVLLSTRAPIGKVGIVAAEMYCNQGFKSFICSNQINSIFLYYTLKSNKEYLCSLGTGTTFKELSKKVVEGLKLAVPPIDLQKQFATIYKQADKSKFELRKSIDAIDQVIKSLING